MAKYSQYDILEIDWEDTCTTQGWCSNRRLKGGKPARCRTVGYLFEETKSYVSVGISIDRRNESWMDTQTIPRGCIKKIKRIKKKE